MRFTIVHYFSRLLSFFLLLAPCGLQAQMAHELSSNGHVGEFRIFGPFHQEGLRPDDWADLLEIEFVENDGELG